MMTNKGNGNGGGQGQGKNIRKRTKAPSSSIFSGGSSISKTSDSSDISSTNASSIHDSSSNYGTVNGPVEMMNIGGGGSDFVIGNEGAVPIVGTGAQQAQPQYLSEQQLISYSMSILNSQFMQSPLFQHAFMNGMSFPASGATNSPKQQGQNSINSLPNSQSSSNPSASSASTPKGKPSPSVSSLPTPCQMPFGTPIFHQNTPSLPSITPALASFVAQNQLHSQQPPHSNAPPPSVQQSPQMIGAPALSPHQLNNLLRYLININMQKQQQQCNNNAMHAQQQINLLIQQLLAQQQKQDTLKQNTNAGMGIAPFGMNPFIGQQQMPAGNQNVVKQRNLTEGSQKSGKKSLVKLNSAGDAQKSAKRRSSMQSQNSITSSQGTGGSSSTTTLSMNSQQSVNSNFGTPLIERLSMEELKPAMAIQNAEMKAKQMQPKQKKGGGGKSGNKEVTSAGGRVPKKTRRMSVDVDCSPATTMDPLSINGSTPSSAKSIQMDSQFSQNSAGPNISPNGSLSSSPAGTIASPSEPTNLECEWADCHEKFANAEAFISHVTDAHVSFETTPHFYCRWKTCKRADPFTAQYMLAQHVRKHTGDKPYLCDHVDPEGVQCVKRYSRLENLKTHQRTHTGDRPYQCAHCNKTFTNASDKAKHQNRTHKDEKDYGCPVHLCTKRYTDPSSLRKHVCHEHGEPVWKFAKANKEQKKAKDYGVIGIRPDGTPFAMPSGTSSSDEDRDVDVMSTTPPPGGQLPTLKENEAEMPMTGTDFTRGGMGGGGIGGGGGYSGVGALNEQKQEIKQEPASPTNPIGNEHGQQWKLQQKMASQYFVENNANKPSIPLHVSPAQNQQWQQQQTHSKLGGQTPANGSPMKSKPTAIAAVAPSRREFSLPAAHLQQNWNGHPPVESAHSHQSFPTAAFNEFSPQHSRRLPNAHHHSFDEPKRDRYFLPNSANSIEFGGTEWREFPTVAAAYANDGTTIGHSAAPVNYIPQRNFGYSKYVDNVPPPPPAAPLYQQPIQHHSSLANSSIQLQYCPSEKQHYSAYIPQQNESSHRHQFAAHSNQSTPVANAQFHQNRQLPPIFYQQAHQQPNLMPNQRSRHFSGPESGDGHQQQMIGGQPIMMDLRQDLLNNHYSRPNPHYVHQMPPTGGHQIINGQRQLIEDEVNEEAASILIGSLQINNKDQQNAGGPN